MDLRAVNGGVSGIAGLEKTICEGVFADPRWFLERVETASPATGHWRVLTLGYQQGDHRGTIEIRIKEEIDG